MHARDVGGTKGAAPPGPDEGARTRHGPMKEPEPVENGEATLEFGTAASVDPDKVCKTIAHTVRELAARQGWTERTACKVQLVLDELAVNIVTHGRSQVLTPHIEVRIACAEGTVRIDVKDNGVAFDPLTEAPPVPSRDRGRPVSIGGLGVHLVKEMTRTMAYRHEGGRNHLRLTIGLE